MDSSTPQSPPPDLIVGDPGAGWRRFARFGAVIYAITTFGNIDVLNRLACNLWLPGDPVMETLLRRLLFISALAVGPVYFILSSPRSLQPGVQRAVGTVVIAALWITGLLPLHYLFFDTVSGVPLSPWAFGYSAVYLFILLALLLFIRRMHPAPRILLLGSIPLAVAGVMLMAGDTRIRQGVGNVLLPAVASMAILISWLFWCAYVQRQLCGDNLWWVCAWRRLDEFDPINNKWVAAVSGDVGRKMARISAVACALTFALFWSEFGRMSLPHPIDWPPGLDSAMSWAQFLMLLGIGPLYAILCSPHLSRPGPLRVLGWGLLLIFAIAGLTLLSFYVFSSSRNPIRGRFIGLITLQVMIVLLIVINNRRLPPANQLVFLWSVPLIFSFSLLAIIYFNSGMFAYPGDPWPARRAILIYSICLYAIGMGGFLWFLPSMQIKKRGRSNSSTTSGAGTSPAPPPVTESNP